MTVLFLRDLPDLDSEHAVLVDIVLVGLVTCDKNDVLVGVAEGDLRADGVSSWVLEGLVGDTALLVHLPNVDRLLRLRRERGKQLVVFGAESHRDEGLVLRDLSRADNLALSESLSVRLTLLVRLTVVIDSVDCADRGLVALLCNSEGATVLGDCHRGYAFGTLDARERLLGLVLDVVDHDVVTGGIDNLVVVQEEDVIGHVRLQSRDELRLKSDL